MSHKIISTDQAPAAIGPYNQGVCAGGFLFTAGQIPLNPATGEVVGTTAAQQARRALANAQAIVVAGGLTLADVVKVTLFVRDLADFGVINEVYQEFFPGEAPARAIAEVSGLPKDVLVEVDMVAYGLKS